MRTVSDTLASILTGPFQRRLIVDVFYDDEPTFTDLPVTDWSLTGDLESEIKTTGTLDVTYNSVDGRGLSPRGFLDVLAPYGQQVNVLLECSLRKRVETVLLGRFRINEVPETSESYLRFAGRTLVDVSRVRLTIDDLLSGVKRNGIRWPAPPAIADSTWDELQRLSGLPIAPSLADKPTPPGLVYQPREGGRLLAVQQLATWLGGIATTTSLGELTVVPFVPGEPVLTLTHGRIKAPPRSLSTDQLKNHVVGTYQEADGTPIYAEDWVRSGPLRMDGPYGPSTAYDQSDIVRTQQDADARVRAVLAQLLANQTYRLTLSCRLDPRIESGDVVQVIPLDGVPITGRVVSWKIDRGTFMTVVLDVARDVPAA